MNDREKMLADLQRAYRMACNTDPDGFVQFMEAHGEKLTALLDAEPVAWIPMSEGRIPEPTPYPDGKSYRVALVALNDGSGVYLSEAMYDEGEGKWLTAGGVPESHFTHWRPFPAPPGGQR